jgi:hypothetical protein
VVLINGCIKGTWEYKQERTRAVVTVNLFALHPGQIEEGIRVEAERFGRFLDQEVELVYD